VPQEVRALVAEVRGKAAEAAEAEHRFHELEALMQRLASRCEGPYLRP
jgi:hypothetical protein